MEDPETKMTKDKPYELLEDDEKKQLGKNNKAKMTLYNTLPRKEFERNCKIDLLTQEYEKFLISKEETIDSGFIRVNAIVTSLKSLDPDYSSKNHVRKFLHALPLKWRAKVMAIEEAKDLATLSLDKLVRNLKGTTSNDCDSQRGSDENLNEEEEAYAFNWMARNFLKFFRKGNQFGRDNQFGNGTNKFRRDCGDSFRNKGGESSKQKGACYNYRIEGHFASECRKPDKNKAFVGGAWSDSEDDDERQNDTTCIMEIDSQEVCLKCDLLLDNWIVDSGCTKHMTENKRLFSSYKAYDDGHVVFRSNLKGKVIGGGNITHDSITVTNVKHVSGLAFNLISVDLKEHSEEEVAGTMTETMEEYMCKTRGDYGLGVTRPKIDAKDNFKLNVQFLKELCDNTFSGSNYEDANDHIEKVLEIVDLFHIPNITQDQIMLRAFLLSLTGAMSHWLRNKPSSLITTWEDLKAKFLSKYCPPARIAKKMEEINNFQQEPNETLYQAWESFKELLMKCPQYYLTDIQENGSYGLQYLNTYGATRLDDSIPRKEKDPGSFTLPCELSHTKLTVELANRTVKHPKGIAKNAQVGIVVEDMDPYLDEGMGDVIVGEL
ncbi:zf-CCHC domain-containing protein [Tanacetum coccineum]